MIINEINNKFFLLQFNLKNMKLSFQLNLLLHTIVIIIIIIITACCFLESNFINSPLLLLKNFGVRALKNNWRC